MVRLFDLRWLRLLAALLLVSSAAAAEYAVLKSGFRLKVARHERRDGRLRLVTENGGVMELPASAVVAFEQEDFPSQPEPPAAQQPTDELRPKLTAGQLDAVIEELAAAEGLPPALIRSVIRAESNFNPEAVSPKGAAGLMQLMPATAAELDVADRFDPEENVSGGAAYLRSLLERYSGQDDQLLRALAAYNAGPARVDRYGGLPPFDETRLFVRKVIRDFLDRTSEQASSP